MPPYSSIAEALTALPDGPEAIADHLAELGVRGSCNDTTRCVIAEYLTTTVAVRAGLFVRVSNHAASLCVAAGALTRLHNAVERVWFADLGRLDISEFVANFDRGQYPALVEATPATVAA